MLLCSQDKIGLLNLLVQAKLIEKGELLEGQGPF